MIIFWLLSPKLYDYRHVPAWPINCHCRHHHHHHHHFWYFVFLEVGSYIPGFLSTHCVANSDDLEHSVLLPLLSARITGVCHISGLWEDYGRHLTESSPQLPNWLIKDIYLHIKVSNGSRSQSLISYKILGSIINYSTPNIVLILIFFLKICLSLFYMH